MWRCSNVGPWTASHPAQDNPHLIVDHIRRDVPPPWRLELLDLLAVCTPALDLISIRRHVGRRRPAFVINCNPFFPASNLAPHCVRGATVFKRGFRRTSHAILPQFSGKRENHALLCSTGSRHQLPSGTFQDFNLARGVLQACTPSRAACVPSEET